MSANSSWVPRMNSKQARWTQADSVFVVLGFVFLFLHVFTVFPVRPIFYEEDHLYFIQDAWRMYRGETLYKDFFEYTFPGTQLLYLFLLEVFGTRFWLINAVIIAQGLALALLCLAISKHLFENRWHTYLAPALFLFFGFRWFGIDGSHRMLSPIFAMLAILILLGRRTIGRIAAAGVLCALTSFFTQQRGILVAGGISVFLLIEAIKSRSEFRQLFVMECALAGTFILALAVLVSPFIWSAGANTFFDHTIFYIRSYIQEPTANYGAYRLLFEKTLEQGVVISGVMIFYYLLIPLVYGVTFVCLWRKTYDTKVLLVALVGFFLAVGTFAPTPARIFQICTPGLIVLTWLIVQGWPLSAPATRVAVIALVLFGGALAARLQLKWDKRYLDTPTGELVFLSPLTLERFEWLRKNAIANEYVFEVYQCAVNFALQLPNPTRVTFLLDNGYTPAWQVAQAIGDLMQKRPRLIIWDGNWSKDKAQRNADDSLAPFYDYLLENYELRQAFVPYSNRAMEAWEIK